MRTAPNRMRRIAQRSRPHRLPNAVPRVGRVPGVDKMDEAHRLDRQGRVTDSADKLGNLDNLPNLANLDKGGRVSVGRLLPADAATRPQLRRRPLVQTSATTFPCIPKSAWPAERAPGWVCCSISRIQPTRTVSI